MSLIFQRGLVSSPSHRRTLGVATSTWEDGLGAIVQIPLVRRKIAKEQVISSAEE